MTNMFSNALLGSVFILTLVGFGKTAISLDDLTKKVDEVEIESIASSADAICLPNRVCVVKVDQEVSDEELRKYLASCLHSHQKWLQLNSPEVSAEQ